MVKRITKGDNEILDSVNFFRTVNEIDESQFHVLMNVSRQRNLARGEILIQEGTESTDLYFLMEGQLGVYLYEEDSHKHIQVGLIRPGEMIGDLSLALAEDRLATVRTVSDSAKVISLRIEVFKNRSRYPEIKDQVHFIFWRDLIHSLKWRIDIFEMKYSDSPRIESLASKAREIRREVPSVHSFAFDNVTTLKTISEQASEIASILTQCNQLVAGHRAMEIE